MLRFELSWQAAAIAAAALLGLATAIAFAREAGTVLALFALWQLAGSYAVMGPGGALARARWLWHLERVLHLPSEATVQRAFLPYPLLIEAFNLYYAVLHFAVLIGCLIWMFARHREHYPAVRNLVVIFTGLALLVQLIPVAPPRMLPGDGMVDTAVKYGQSVYSVHPGFNPDQLSAMPSVHVGWALIVALAAIRVLHSKWRYLALGYPALTTLVVVVTANHFWLDGIVAAALVGLALLLQRAGRWLMTVARGVAAGQRARRPPASQPVGERVGQPAGQPGLTVPPGDYARRIGPGAVPAPGQQEELRDVH
jgi:PAP2 superfamily